MRVWSRVCLLSLCSPFLQGSLLANPDPVKDASWSELVKSEIKLSTTSEVQSASDAIWKKYQEEALADTERQAQHENQALEFGDKTMKFTLEKRGEPGPQGYPVYIALHGGGTAPASVNESQWHHMQIYYRDSVESGIYIAPRGVTDTWNLHFRPESYALYDRLIENLITYENADPNRIYILGFSAGGDAVYQITPRMPDRWAAANMSAGHHNSVRFDNLLNTPFLIQVGENDSAYKRNRVAVENWQRLQDFQKQHSGYTNDIFVHAKRGHNGWRDNDAQGQQQTILADPAAWLASGDQTTRTTDTNAVHWLKQWERSSQPAKLIWDLGTRSKMRSQSWGTKYVDDASLLAANRELFYWLAVGTEDFENARLEIERIPNENTLRITKAEGISDFKILLNQDQFDFSKPIKVVYQDKTILETQVQAQLNVMARTLLERGDRNFLYHSELLVHLPKADLHNETDADQMFSYCSDGNCRMMSAKRFWQIRRFPLDMHYACVKDNQYALTFDDGPSKNTDRLLDILERHGVKATFFVVGKNLQSPEGQARIQHMHAKGHQIANHTLNHKSLTELSTDDILHQVQATQDLIVQAVGKDPQVILNSRVVRPPYGNIDQKVQDTLKSIGFSSVRWNADRYDWRLKMKDQAELRRRHQQQLDFIAARSLDFNHSILDLNHETSDVTLSILDEALPNIKAQGYEFVTVSECIGLAKL